MPDRIIRDELLTSERYWSVGIEAQQLFTHLLLRADSLGRFSGKNFSIRMACYPGHARNPDVIEKLLSDLHDADLIRLYTVAGERFIFIPRYRQRLRYTNSKYPAPPNEISDIPTEKSDSSQAQVRPAPLEVKRSEVKRRGTTLKPNKVKNKAQAPFVLPDWIPEKQWDAWLEMRAKARKAPTDFAKRLAVSKLRELQEQGHHPAAVLAQSAFSGWAGLFPIKEQTTR